MTCIVFDGNTLAADKLADVGGLMRRVSKLRIEGRYVLTYCGDAHMGEALINWFLKEGPPSTFPMLGVKECDHEATNLLAYDSQERCMWEWGTNPYPVKITEFPIAWGTGREIAIGALHMGASAKQAVEAANSHHVACGLGVDCIDVSQMGAKVEPGAAPVAAGRA